MTPHPPDPNSWGWETLDSLQLAAGSQTWIVAVAIAPQPDGWYIQVTQQAAVALQHHERTLAGPYPDRASATLHAVDWVTQAMAAMGGQITEEHRNGIGVSD